MTTLEKEVLLEFIKLYRDRPCMWDKKLPSYTNKTLRNRALQELLVIYKKYDPGGNIASVRNKIDTMRSNYNRERKKVIRSYAKGTPEEDVYKPSLWYYEEMSFISNCSEIDLSCIDGMEEDWAVQNEASDSGTSQPVKKMKFSRKKKKKSQISEHIGKDDDEKSSDDEFDSFGKMAAIQLRKLNHPHQAIAIKLMSDVLFYAKMELLNESSTISTIPRNYTSILNTPNTASNLADDYKIVPDF